jgi:hypothetical protein
MFPGAYFPEEFFTGVYFPPALAVVGSTVFVMWIMSD